MTRLSRIKENMLVALEHLDLYGALLLLEPHLTKGLCQHGGHPCGKHETF